MNKNNKNAYKVISLFAGAGGLDLGFKNAGFDIVWSNEIDEFASETYKLNFGDHITTKSITEVKKKELPAKVDILIGGFPCQPFSIAGYRKGFEDTRGELFWQVIRIINATKPEAVVLENVRNLFSHDDGNTFKVIVEALESKGYFVKWEVINSNTQNIPQNRERIFIVGFKDNESFKEFIFPKKKKLTKKYTSALIKGSHEEKYYYDRFPKIHKLLKDSDKNTVLQFRRHYIRENKKHLFPTLTANMGTGGHNVPIIYDGQRFRKITPREAFNVQGFPKSFKFPKGMSDSKLYKQAGNAVSVPVAKAVAFEVLKALKNRL